MKRRTWMAGVVAGALVLTAAGCGAGSGSGDSKTRVIRFAFAPDPVWSLMADNGLIKKWEAKNNVKIKTSTTWDEFTYFAGGHGDIVSLSTQETPVLEQETKVKTVTFGKYNYLRVPMYRRAGDPYETLADIPKGSKICVSGPTSNSAFWGVAAQQLHGLDYRVGGGDFKLVVNDHFVNPTNLLRGDCEAAAIIPEAAVPYMRKGQLEIMYGGKLPFQLYNDFSKVKSGEKQVMGNNFVATEKWFNANKDLAVKFLELWQSGIKLWKSQQAETIARYPQHFSVENQKDISFMQKFITQNDRDWFVDNVFLTEDWIKAETAIWDMQKQLNPSNPNYLAPNAPRPRFVALAPTS